MSAPLWCQSVACAIALLVVSCLVSACDAASGPQGMAPDAPLPVSDMNYTQAMLAQDVATVLQYHNGIYSNRPLGNTDNVRLWTPAKVALLYQALVATQTTCYTAIALGDLAHLVLAEAAAESTGNYNVGVGGPPGGGWGLLQVTPKTVVADYDHHGSSIVSAAGTVLLQPSIIHDLGDPGVNTLLWGWYTKNTLAFGISADQAALDQRGQVTPDYGNALLAWLQGPGHDRHQDANNVAYLDYYQRVEDYFVQARFGTARDFTTLMQVNVGTQPAAWRG